MRQVDGTEALARVREMRRAATPAETLLWGRLRNRRLEGTKFYRQVWLGPFILDFLCKQAKLGVELDGSQHADAANYDAARSAFLAREGVKIVRFWNNDVLFRTDDVLAAIRAGLLERLPSPSHSALPSGSLPLPGGERG